MDVLLSLESVFFFPEKIFCLFSGISQTSIVEPSLVAVGTLLSTGKGGTKLPQSGKSVGCRRNPTLLHCFHLVFGLLQDRFSSQAVPHFLK